MPIQLETSATSKSIAIGITVGLIASFIQSLGLTIQRKSHVINQSLPEHLQRVEHRRPLWLTGFAIFICSNVFGSVFQIASLPVVILAPLGAVSLLWNALFSRFLLGDLFSPWMIVGTIVIAVGAVLIGVFGIVPEPTHSLEDLLELLGRPAFILYFSLLSFVVIIALVVTHAIEYSLSRKHTSPGISTPSSTHRISFPPAQGMSTATYSEMESTERTPLLEQKALKYSPEDLTIANTRTLLALSYAAASGTLSGMCLIFAKSGVELLLLTISGHNQFWRWESWVLLLGLIVLALLQLWYMHKGLTFANPTIVCPLAFCFYNSSSIVSGLVYFDQFSMMTLQQLLLVSLGALLLLSGVWVVSFHGGGGIADVADWQDETAEASPTGGIVQDPEGRTNLPEESSSLAVISTPNLRSLHSEPIDRVLHQRTLSQQHTLSVRKHRRSFLQPAESHMPGGGFSIGLSPMSPGFTLIPKKRSSTFSHVVGKLALRRAVSEGNVRYGEPFQQGFTTTDEHVANEIRQHKVANARWRWLRNIFLNGNVQQG